MANTESVKHERMHIRLDALAKQKLERAGTCPASYVRL